MPRNVAKEASDIAEKNRMLRGRDIIGWLLWLLAAAYPCSAWTQTGTKGEAQTPEEAAQRRLTYYYIAALNAAKEDASSMADLLQHCLDIDSVSPAAHYNLGLLYYGIGRGNLCLEHIRKAVAHDPQNPTYKETLASALMATRQMDKAIPVLEDMTRLQSRRTDILAQLFELYKSAGRTTDAIRVLERIKTLLGNNTRIAGQEYALYLDMGDTLQAFEQLKELCREFPYDATNHILLGDQYMTIAAHDSALAAYGKAERIDPRNINLLLSRMQYPLLTGDTLRYRALRDSIVLDGGADMTLRVRALAALLKEAYNDPSLRPHAAEVFDTLLRPDKPDVTFLQMYLSYKTATENATEQELIPTMERILHVRPDHQETLEAVLQYYIARNDVKGIERLCQSAIIYHPSELLFHYFLGVSLTQQDRNGEAVTALTTAIRQANEDSRPEMLGNIYALLGNILHEMGQEEATFEAYDSCLAYTPDHVMCLNNYAYFLSEKGKDLDKAEKMSYRVIKAQPDNRTYLDTYAWILFMQKDYTTARNYMERIIDYTQNDSTLLANSEISTVLLEHAGDIYAQCGLTEQALRMWKLAREKSPEEKNAVLNRKIKKRKYIRK